MVPDGSGPEEGAEVIGPGSSTERPAERPDCGGFDVLGLRWMGETLRPSDRDGCGLWMKVFGEAP